MEFTIGCDPETFIKLHDKYVPAFGLLPGTKEKPYEVEGGAVQVDGLAFEFNINPAKTPVEFNTNIEKVLAQMDEMIKNTIDKDATIEFIPLARFDDNIFNELPEEAKILGCDPDFNIKGKTNPSPRNIVFQPIRVAAGHIHIGWREPEEITKSHFDDCVHISNHLWNNKLGINSLDTVEKQRLSYYGNNGAFRPKKYGIEYRVPSNRWVASAESRLKMFGQTMTLMKKAL